MASQTACNPSSAEHSAALRHQQLSDIEVSCCQSSCPCSQAWEHYSLPVKQQLICFNHSKHFIYFPVWEKGFHFFPLNKCFSLRQTLAWKIPVSLQHFALNPCFSNPVLALQQNTSNYWQYYTTVYRDRAKRMTFLDLQISRCEGHFVTGWPCGSRKGWQESVLPPLGAAMLSSPQVLKTVNRNKTKKNKQNLLFLLQLHWLFNRARLKAMAVLRETEILLIWLKHLAYPLQWKQPCSRERKGVLFCNPHPNKPHSRK